MQTVNDEPEENKNTKCKERRDSHAAALAERKREGRMGDKGGRLY